MRCIYSTLWENVVHANLCHGTMYFHACEKEVIVEQYRIIARYTPGVVYSSVDQEAMSYYMDKYLLTLYVVTGNK